jgi:hypothetical protein
MQCVYHKSIQHFILRAIARAWEGAAWLEVREERRKKDPAGRAPGGVLFVRGPESGQERVKQASPSLPAVTPTVPAMR